MSLLVLNNSFVRELEKSKAVAVYSPLEGGFEGRYQRRLRLAGYTTLNITARGLGDLGAYLTGVHGVRPPHLGKKNIAQEAAVGPVYYAAPVASYQVEHLKPKSKGLVLWIIEGFVLSQEEIEYLINLPTLEPKIKVVVELGGDRTFTWKPLQKALSVA